jgi:hypothetical protein
MRLSGTPAEWRPQGPVLRHRSLDHHGYPILSIGFGVVALGAGAVGAMSVVRRVLLPHPRFDWPAIGLTALALFIGIACAYVAIDRLLRGQDSAVEVDRAGRALLSLSVHGKPAIIPFDAIQAIAVTRSDSHYTSGRHKVYASVIALPSRASLFTCQGENMVSRDLAVGRVRDIAREIAAAVGVPVVEAPVAKS